MPSGLEERPTFARWMEQKVELVELGVLQLQIRDIHVERNKQTTTTTKLVFFLTFRV